MNRRPALLVAPALLGLLSLARTSLAQPTEAPAPAPTSADEAAPTLTGAKDAAPAPDAPDRSDARLAPSPPEQAAVAVVTGPAPAQAPDSTDADPPQKERPAPHPITTEIGARVMYIVHEGYDPYAEGNGYGQLSLAGSYTVLRGIPFSVAAGLEWNVGNANAEARGDETSLTIHRLAASVQARYAPVQRLSIFAKLAPAAYHLRGTIEDAELSQTLKARAWTWGLDATGGAALLLGSSGKESQPSASFWLSVELGYTFAGEVEMIYRPDNDEDEVRHFGDIRLPNIRPSGFINRFAFGVSF